ncbi:hypothetical protein AABB24_009642 [Solanum stoloniferum]|uniref:Uncharacterized protein n=1 Tax=Solanum stoloniferum TaxID=62892 RepID=A0ABD2UJH2_9SOLN
MWIQARVDSVERVLLAINPFNLRLCMDFWDLHYCIGCAKYSGLEQLVGRRYPRSASSTPLIQLSTPESVVCLFVFRRTRLCCSLSFVLLGCCGVCPNIHLSIIEAS